MPEQLTSWAEETLFPGLTFLGGVSAIVNAMFVSSLANYVTVKDANSKIHILYCMDPTVGESTDNIVKSASYPNGFTSPGVPTICNMAGATAHGRFNIYAPAATHELNEIKFDEGNLWSDWAPLYKAGAQNIGLGVSAINTATGIDVYAVLVDKTASNTHYNGTSWAGWNSLGGAFITPPSPCLMNPSRQDLFAINTSNQVCQKTRGVTGWVPSTYLGKAVAAFCRADTTIDLLFIGMDNLLHYVFFSNGGWGPVITISQTKVIGPTIGVCTGAVAIDTPTMSNYFGGQIAPNNNRLDVYAIGTDSKLHHFHAGWFLPPPPGQF